jgi:hypothetical protein
MSPSRATNAATAREWRKLGFFYEKDEAQRAWRLIGSRSGLFGFARLLRDYSANPHLAGISEHEHYGPYFYLKVITWQEPLITRHDIRGTQPDIGRLADLIEDRLRSSAAGQTFTIDTDYSPGNEFHLHFELREENFDAAAADPLLPASSISEA